MLHFIICAIAIIIETQKRPVSGVGRTRRELWGRLGVWGSVRRLGGGKATSHKPQATSHRPQATRHKPQATSHKTQGTSHKPQGTGHEPQCERQGEQRKWAKGRSRCRVLCGGNSGGTHFPVRAGCGRRGSGTRPARPLVAGTFGRVERPRQRAARVSWSAS
jgi:hypothetical protein